MCEYIVEEKVENEDILENRKQHKLSELISVNFLSNKEIW